MYEHILNELSGVVPSPDNGFSVYARCDNTNDFVHHLKDIIHAKDTPTHTVFIVRNILRDTC